MGKLTSETIFKLAQWRYFKGKLVFMKTALVAAGLALLMAGCAGIPSEVQPVDGFKIDKYIGRWYEIARMDHSFERGLSRVSAEYSLRDDGGVRVLNRGFSVRDNAWKQAEGKAYFVGQPDRGLYCSPLSELRNKV